MDVTINARSEVCKAIENAKDIVEVSQVDGASAVCVPVPNGRILAESAGTIIACANIVIMTGQRSGGR